MKFEMSAKDKKSDKAEGRMTGKSGAMKEGSKKDMMMDKKMHKGKKGTK
jgi:hypothetical protein